MSKKGPIEFSRSPSCVYKVAELAVLTGRCSMSVFCVPSVDLCDSCDNVLAICCKISRLSQRLGAKKVRFLGWRSTAKPSRSGKAQG